MIKTTKNAIFWGSQLLAFAIGGNVLVRTSARVKLGTDPKNHTAFDTALASFKLPITYVEQFDNPAEQFKKWLAKGGSTPVTLTAEELRVPELLKQIEAKFSAATPPTAPYTFSNQKPVASEALRLTPNGKSVKNKGGYQISLSIAKRIFTIAQAYWTENDGTPSSTRLGTDYARAQSSSRRIEVYPSFVNIGCQRIDRVAAETLAKAQGWVS